MGEVPQSREAEMNFLGSVISWESLQFKPLIKDFYYEDTRKLYQIIRKLDKEKLHIDLVAIKDRIFNEYGEEEAKELFTFMIECQSWVFTSHSMETYFKIIKEKSWKRKLITLWESLATKAETLSGKDLVSYMGELRGELDKLSEALVDDNGNDSEGLLDAYMEYAGDNSLKRDIGCVGYQTGIKLIDDNCDGLQPGTVTRLAAYTNTGKTRFLMEILVKLLRQWISVSFFSTEVVKKLFITNLISAYTKLSFRALKYWDVIERVPMDEIKNLPLKFYDSVSDLNEIIFLSKKNGSQVIMVDFAQNIDAWAYWEFTKNMAMYARDIQKFAIQNNVAVFDLSQIDGASQKEKQDTWYIAAKYSQSLVESADVFLHLSKAETQPSDERQKALKLTIQKNKYWPAFISTWLLVNFEFSTFLESPDLVSWDF